MTRRTLAVVGAGLCGASAAIALREKGFDGRVVLIGEEVHPPYDRPPLSKDFLKGGDPPFLGLDDKARALDVDVELGRRVSAVRPSERRVELEDGASLQVDGVCLAVGGRVRRLRVEGADPDAILYLRTLDDAVRLRDLLRRGGRVVVVGAGFIGGEVASTARALGCEVTLVEIANDPFARVLGPWLGAYLARLHEERGVDVRAGVGLERVACRGGDVEGVVLTDGTAVDADAVVVGIGIEPNVELARQAGCAVGNGVSVGAGLQTSVPGVWAAGDVALRDCGQGGMRLEHWRNALDQAAMVASAMLGDTVPEQPVPWFWSDQHGVNIQMAGHPHAGDAVVVRGSLEEQDCTVLYVRDGRIRGVVGLNRPAEVRAAMTAIADGRGVDEHRLADCGTPLKRLLASASVSAV